MLTTMQMRTIFGEFDSLRQYRANEVQSSSSKLTMAKNVASKLDEIIEQAHPNYKSQIARQVLSHFGSAGSIISQYLSNN